MSTDDRVQLESGTTIRDVWERFADGLQTPRSEEELRTVIHASGLLYSECARLSVALRWAEQFVDDPRALVSLNSGWNDTTIPTIRILADGDGCPVRVSVYGDLSNATINAELIKYGAQLERGFDLWDAAEGTDESVHPLTAVTVAQLVEQIQAELERIDAASDDRAEGIDCYLVDGEIRLGDRAEEESLSLETATRLLAALRALPDRDDHENGFECAWRAYNEVTS